MSDIAEQHDLQTEQDLQNQLEALQSQHSSGMLPTHQDILVKEKFLAATSSDTLRSKSRTGKPARQLRTAWTDAWEDPANPKPLPMPLQPMLIDTAIRRIDRAAHDSSSGAAQLAN